MLRTATYKMLSMLLLVNFIAASTGLSIYFHKCSCEHRLITTLFLEHKCHEEQVSSCCSLESFSKNPRFSESSCGCKTEHLTIKVNDFFNAVNPSELGKKIEVTTSQILFTEPVSDLISQYNIQNQKYYLPDSSPPKKVVGKDLIILLHQSKASNLIS